MAEDNMNPTPSPTGGQNQGGQPTPFEAPVSYTHLHYAQ